MSSYCVFDTSGDRVSSFVKTNTVQQETSSNDPPIQQTVTEEDKIDGLLVNRKEELRLKIDQLIQESIQIQEELERSKKEFNAISTLLETRKQ